MDPILPSTITHWDDAATLFAGAIASGNQSVQLRALLHLARVSRGAHYSALSATVPPLLDLLRSPRPSLQSAAALALRCVAAASRFGLSSPIAVETLLSLLPDSRGPLRISLLRCVNALVVFDDGNRLALVRNGRLGAVLELIGRCREDEILEKRYLMEILSALAQLRAARRVVVSLGGLRFLVDAVSCGKMRSRTRAAHAIGLLGTVRRLRHMLVDSGAIPALVGLLKDGDTPARIVAGNALGIVCSHMEYIRLAAQAIPLYAELLEGSDALGREIAEDVLCVLVVAEENAVPILEHLVRILKDGTEDAKAAVLDVFWNLSGCEHSVCLIRASGAFPLLLEIFQEGNGDIKEKALGLIAQLSYCGANRKEMVEVGIVPVLIDLLASDSEELKEFAVEALMNYVDDPVFGEQVSEASDTPSFQAIQDRLIQIGISNERMGRTMRLLSDDELRYVEQFTSRADLL